ncbi:Nucleotide-binding universal stress protein, UspA family [Reichenbachiella faecimaris]|uniref:Nucleotide-binding universal stress protein, UspA family n=1 Tax=Reichenbachiella faecimaris TaxID=692418 RepID=A0A1W2G5L6_REIFA|nr:universal stress protein [Reichenbachiella faecimaris]SMD31960.1 Nucleotide-binding universal stress protein, UspA family [Reichenbachiella faecimaris]
MKINTILVPMDYSPCAKNAFETALILAKKAQANIQVVSVSHMPHIHAEVVGAASIIQPLLQEYHEQLDQQFEELISSSNIEEVSVTNTKYNAPLHDAIYSCTIQNECDLIVTGTKSQQDWLTQLVGSNSMDMVERAKIPVLVIPERVKSPSFKKIGVAVDYSDFTDPEILAPLRDFATFNFSSLCFLNVTEKQHKLFVYDDVKLRISDYFNGLKQSYHTFTDSRPLDEILNEAINDLGLGMLFMLPKNHSIIERLIGTRHTKSMVKHIAIPLMTIHEK